MQETRRRWISTLVGGLGMLVLAPLAGGQRAAPQPRPSPNAPDEHAPAGLERPPMGSSETNNLNPQLEHEIKSDVEKLFMLASELKQQVESTDLNSVLALGIVKKAQQIEKLAKHIKEHAKG